MCVAPDSSMKRRLNGVRSGFTLIEVLVAMGIFAVGIIAVAAVYPAAILLQKQTIAAVEAKEFSRNAEAMVRSLGFEDTSGTPWSGLDNADVSPLPQSAYDTWSIADRSYNVSSSVANRRTFWVPLIFDGDSAAGSTTAWRIYLFVVRGSNNYYYNHAAVGNPPLADDNATTRDANYVPAVCRAAINWTGDSPDVDTVDNNFQTTTPDDVDLLNVGDQIVSDQGVIYTITAIDKDNNYATVDAELPSPAPNYYWYAHPGYDSNNTSQLLTTSSFVKLIVMLDDNDTQDIVRP